MTITEQFVLRKDVLLTPCASLGDDVRRRIVCEEGDFTLSHRRGRSVAQVIDAETAALLSLFREPFTIVEAVVENSRRFGLDPRARLHDLLPHLGGFLQTGVLVPAGSSDEEIRPQYGREETFAGWTVVRCASLIADSEVYQVRRGDELAALKVARADTSRLQKIFENEIAALRHLDGAGIAPRLLDAGVDEGRPYLAMEWVDGVDAGVAAAQRRHDRAGLIDLCASIAEAYALLHERGVVHGDVHPRNVIIGKKPVLIDFGYCRSPDGPRVGRAGIRFFQEPELLTARGSGKRVPATPAGEQFSLAALLYLLITGQHYLEFSYEREEMERQVRLEAPLPFSARGIAPWPEVEEILHQALAKDPARRHASTAALAARLRDVRDEALRETLAAPVNANARALLENTLQSFTRGGSMYTSGYTSRPVASISYGSAGAAVALLQIAQRREDAALLAFADIWRSRAEAAIADDAWYVDSLVPRDKIGEVTPYHTESGVHVAAAMVAAAFGDSRAQRRAVSAFLRASTRRCPEIDLTLGRCGSLLATAMLLPAGDRGRLRAFGSKTMREIWSELDARPPIAASAKRTYLGMAHGWTGYLYATLRWCVASGEALPHQFVDRLHQLAAMKIPRGRGVYWPITAGNERMMAGWCNGSAGALFLFTLAHRVLGESEWLALAELAAWNNWEEPFTGATLCCGAAGRAYALLSLYKHTGATEWLARARRLANHAADRASTPKHPGSLWKGELGVAALIADLESPEHARMPFFE